MRVSFYHRGHRGHRENLSNEPGSFGTTSGCHEQRSVPRQFPKDPGSLRELHPERQSSVSSVSSVVKNSGERVYR
jgi:hypothetical protein